MSFSVFTGTIDELIGLVLDSDADTSDLPAWWLTTVASVKEGDTFARRTAGTASFYRVVSSEPCGDKLWPGPCDNASSGVGNPASHPQGFHVQAHELHLHEDKCPTGKHDSVPCVHEYAYVGRYFVSLKEPVMLYVRDVISTVRELQTLVLEHAAGEREMRDEARTIHRALSSWPSKAD